MKMKLLLIDNCEVFREGLLKLAQSELNIDAVAIFGTESKIIEAIRKHKPNIVIVDPCSFESIDVISSIKQVAPKVHIIGLTHSKASTDFISFMSRGAAGYILKDIKYANLLKVIDLVIEGKLVIDQSMARLAVDLLNFIHDHMHVTVETEQVISLTDQEKAILVLLAKDATNKEIASSLYVTENTVKVHIRNIMHKLHTRSRLEAGIWAIKEGLLRNGASPP